MAIGSRSRLVTAGRGLSESIEKKASLLSQNSDVFLAHSSADKGALLTAAIKVLEVAGATVYADYLDPEAKLLKPKDFGKFFAEAVQETGRLVVVLTEKTSQSRWVPWELGLAHGCHAVSRAAIWPLAEDGSPTNPAWVNQEYMLQYPRVEWVTLAGVQQWAVRDPDDGRVWTLPQWLNV